MNDEIKSELDEMDAACMIRRGQRQLIGSQV